MAKTVEISIRCEHCRTWIPSPIWPGESETFDTGILFNNREYKSFFLSQKKPYIRILPKRINNREAANTAGSIIETEEEYAEQLGRSFELLRETRQENIIAVDIEKEIYRSFDLTSYSYATTKPKIDLTIRLKDRCL